MTADIASGPAPAGPERARYGARQDLTAMAVCCALLMRGAPSALASGAGSSSVEFIKLGVGANAASVGAAYDASARGAEAMFGNVAGMAPLKDRAQFAMTHAPL